MKVERLKKQESKQLPFAVFFNKERTVQIGLNYEGQNRPLDLPLAIHACAPNL